MFVNLDIYDEKFVLKISHYRYVQLSSTKEAYQYYESGL